MILYIYVLMYVKLYYIKNIGNKCIRSFLFIIFVLFENYILFNVILFLFF